MRHYIEPDKKKVCSSRIYFEIDDDGLLQQVAFIGGCDGQGRALAKFIEGMPAEEVATKLRGNACRMRGTSCADQLSRGIFDVLSGEMKLVHDAPGKTHPDRKNQFFND